MNALLRFRDLSVRYPDRDVAAVRNFSAEIRPGECVVLTGPSGAGKSTVLAAASGIVPLSIPAEMTGVVEVATLDSTRDPVSTVRLTVPEMSQVVGTVFQDPDAQIVTGRVLDEVCFAIENQRLSIATVEKRARAALEVFGLSGVADRHPGELSGGQRQRLVLACVHAMQPRMLVLDEPTANLDQEAAEGFFSMLARRNSQAVLLVEHNLDLALTIADRVWELDAHGTLIRDEPVTGSHSTRFSAVPRINGEPQTQGPERSVERSAAITATNVVWAPRKDLPPVLRDFSLQVPRGVVTALTGVNGAGKSSALRLLGGLMKPHSGDISWTTGHGETRMTPPPLGFVFQNPEHQFLSYQVREELHHALRLRGIPQRNLRDEADELLERFGLTGYAALGTSGGERADGAVAGV